MDVFIDAADKRDDHLRRAGSAILCALVSGLKNTGRYPAACDQTVIGFGCSSRPPLATIWVQVIAFHAGVFQITMYVTAAGRASLLK